MGHSHPQQHDELGQKCLCGTLITHGTANVSHQQVQEPLYTATHNNKAKTTTTQNTEGNTKRTINDNIKITKVDIGKTANQTTLAMIPKTPNTPFLTTTPSTANAPMTTWPTNTWMQNRHNEKQHIANKPWPTTTGLAYDDRSNKDLTYEDINKDNRVNANKANDDTANNHNAHRTNRNNKVLTLPTMTFLQQKHCHWGYTKT